MGWTDAYINGLMAGTLPAPTTHINAIAGIDTTIADFDDAADTFLSVVSAALVTPVVAVTGQTFTGRTFRTTSPVNVVTNSGLIRKLLLINDTGSAATSRVCLTIGYGPTAATIIPMHATFGWARI